MMKTFNEFRESLTDEDMEYIAAKANDAIYSMSTILTPFKSELSVA